MLAYAANAPRFGQRGRSPTALTLIVGAHAVALAALMTAKMDMPITHWVPTTMIDIKDPPPPDPVEPPPPPQNPVKPQPTKSVIDQVKPLIPLDPVGPIKLDPPVKDMPIGPIAGAGSAVVTNPPIHEVIRTAARFNTPDWLLKPPYPPSMQAREIEATLRLRLQIDANGRVVAVDPVGRADPAFLEAARKHLIAKWRYRPATEDGRAVASSTVITLRFELEA